MTTGLTTTRQPDVRRGLTALYSKNPLKPLADAQLAVLKTQRDVFVTEIRAGRMTPKVAREQLGRVANQIREQLAPMAEGYVLAPKLYRSELARALDAHSKAPETVESLLKGVASLLKANLVETRLANRSGEYERASADRAGSSPGNLVWSTGSVMGFLESARTRRDDAAVEWGLRKLDELKPAAWPEDRPRIDAAVDAFTPRDVVNERVVARYVERARAQPEFIGPITEEALAEGSASALAAAYACARLEPLGTSAPHVGRLLTDLPRWPASALEAALKHEDACRQAERDDATSVVDWAFQEASDAAALTGVTAPTEQELVLAEHAAARAAGPKVDPVAALTAATAPQPAPTSRLTRLLN